MPWKEEIDSSAMVPVFHHIIPTARGAFDLTSHLPVHARGVYPFCATVCLLISRNKLIRDLGVTHENESQVGYYVGVVVSLDRTPLQPCSFPWSHCT